MLSRPTALFAAMLLAASAARANWFSDKIARNIDLKREVGTGIAVIAQPTIDSAETSSRRVLEQADQIAGARLGQVDALITRQVGGVDALLTRQVGGVDVLLEQRIGQVDRIAATRLKQVDAMLDKDITRIDSIAAKRIQQVDELLTTRIHDVDALLKASITDVDERIGSRIDQVDQITEQRLGNVQTFAAKAAAVVFSGVLWLIGFACLLVFAAAALWRVYKESAGAWPTGGTLWSRIRGWWSKVHNRLAWQILSGAACIAILFFIFFKFLPRGSTEHLVTMHRTAMQKSLDALDLPDARYHASQLKILEPADTAHRGIALKIDLLRDILSRPANYQTPAGINRTLSRIEQAEAQFGEERDADIETLKALILFRTNPTRQGEHDAAMLSAAALKLPPSNSGFALQPLARSYVENYLSHPLTVAEAEAQPDAPEELAPAALAEVVSKAKEDAKSRRTLTPLSHVLMFDSLVRDLTAKSIPAYRRMVEAQAAVESAPPAQRGALIANRAAAAREVIKAWEEFDEALAGHRSLDDTAAAYAVFTLKDAMVSRARAYEKSAAAAIPPILNEKNYPSAAARARMLPPRVMWAKRYLANTGSATQQMITFQEAARFQSDEAAAFEFERAYVDFLKAKTRESALRASLAAARLGLAYGETDLATAIAETLGAEERKSVEQAIRNAPVSYL
jgi:hypothetical protein